MKIKYKSDDKIWIPATVSQILIINDKAYLKVREDKDVLIPIEIVKRRKK